MSDPQQELRALEAERSQHLRSIAKLETRLDAIDAALAQAIRARAELAVWAAVVESSALGKLARAMHEGVKTTGWAAEHSFHQATTLPNIDFEEPRRARNSFVKAMTWTLIVSVAAVVLGLLFFDDLARLIAKYVWSQGWILAVLWTLLVIVILLVVVRVLHRHHKRHLRYVWTARNAEYQLSEAERQFVHSSRERARFDLMRPQLAEWTLILGHVVHSPWQVDPAWATNEDLEELQPIPNCVEVAVPDVSDPTTERTLAVIARRELAGFGWRHRAYQNLLRQMALQEPTGEATDDPVRAMGALIDADSHTERNRMRSLFLEKLMASPSSLKQAEAQEAMLKAAHELLSDEFLASLQVMPLVGDLAAERKGLLETPGGLDRQVPPWKEFLSDISDDRSTVTDLLFSDLVRTGRLPPEFHTVLWFPETRNHPEVRTVGPRTTSQDSTADRPIFTTAAATTNRGIESAVRIDVGSALQPGMLALFESSGDRWRNPVSPVEETEGVVGQSF